MKTTRIPIPLCLICAVTLVGAGVSPAAPDKGETLTKALCMACHGETQAGQKRQAPPMAMVKSRYQSLNKEEMVRAIVKWAKKPDAQHSRMPGAIRNFGLMPPLPLPAADLEAIARYIARTGFKMPNGCNPGNGRGGQGGRGRGQGRGFGQQGRSGR